MAFVDEARIFVKAGDGGKGCESFYRDKYMRHPKPDGGDGGDGGDIVIHAGKSIHTLLDFKYRQHFKAKRGGHGSSKGKTGRCVEDCILKVPVGTIIRDFKTGLLIRDLKEDGQTVIVAKGGRGGRGNKGKKSVDNGALGEERTIHLELKMIADVGLVGFPNAGKSTLICAISKVKSKIARYPFTTKAPILGVVEREDNSFIVADLPGLIEGAHKGKGLGDRFLKHAERTKVLVHLVDMSGGEGRDPIEDYEQIKHELRSYGDILIKKKRIVVANKIDVPAARANTIRLKRKCKEDLIAVSALTGENLERLVLKISKILT